jgi:ribosomal protein L33
MEKEIELECTSCTQNFAISFWSEDNLLVVDFCPFCGGDVTEEEDFEDDEVEPFDDIDNV